VQLKPVASELTGSASGSGAPTRLSVESSRWATTGTSWGSARNCPDQQCATEADSTKAFVTIFEAVALTGCAKVPSALIIVRKTCPGDSASFQRIAI